MKGYTYYIFAGKVSLGVYIPYVGVPRIVKKVRRQTTDPRFGVGKCLGY